MLTTLFVVLPVFGIVVAGFVCGWRGILGPTASSELNRFVVFLGLPALLFDVMAESRWSMLWQPGYIAAFTTASFVVFGGTMAVRLARGQSLTDASIDGLNAGYANTGYIGFPIAEAVFGRDSLALVTIAAILTVSVLFAVAIVFVEIGLQSERRPIALAGKVARALTRNPLLLAPALGAIWSATGFALPDSLARFLHLLGGAASPCALVSLGLFLAARRGGDRAGHRTALGLAMLKLFAQPAITAIFAYGVFRLAALPAAMVVLMAALPTGTGPFMIAEFYRREAVATSATILYSTVASVITLTLCILLLRHLAPWTP